MKAVIGHTAESGATATTDSAIRVTDRPELCGAKEAVALLEAAGSRLGDTAQQVVRFSIARATSILRQQINAPRRRPQCRAGMAVLPSWQARRLEEYIEANIEQPLRIWDLSARVNLSSAHFSRAFKHTFGLTPHAYLVQRRLETASRLMVETADSLTEIALRCGLCDQSHLSRLFRRHMGASPAAWRRHQERTPSHDESAITQLLANAARHASTAASSGPAP
jgi:AraC family transcriptional regulator